MKDGNNTWKDIWIEPNVDVTHIYTVARIDKCQDILEYFSLPKIDLIQWKETLATMLKY